MAEFQRLHPDIEVRMILVPMKEYHMKFKTLAAARALDLFYSGDARSAHPALHARPHAAGGARCRGNRAG